ncbi:SDR family NAD(P)-dependent oxidoreductase [Ruegeria pomeroyi]|nr:SDR family NAD(P)-dependent oxidoreductase [Ruegeria pomeroyi]MCE8520472.1 SDR family NAD(P)-dependent oxidoreductase [Ruegeria pomeroyi]MCE8524979.1 SDR family NAD(P)-dependent oxidoreductase [Ruegeria pomeroyi]MCE8528486.1 SDR family NAD(P)-dependent oxidoreductase [Ruegeria pomeroyi]MCE8533098.1 SDR family NAD(P)-dependent oxidoreductase [Ruegeria pomeroyi]
MTELSGKTYWLVGASEGMGRALARQLNAAGAHLVLSARNKQRLDELCADLENARVLPLDVTNADAVRQAVAVIGDVDGVIYNAGAYEPMHTTQWDSEAALMMCEVNFSGALRVLGEIVPRFLENGQGDITLIGSLAGYRGLPSAIGYGASKAALISLAETMRFDLKDTGVVVRLVNPGFVKTRLTQKNSFRMPMLMTADKAASRVLKAMRKRHFRTDFPAPFSWAIKTLAILPDWLVFRGK